MHFAVDRCVAGVVARVSLLCVSGERVPAPAGLIRLEEIVGISHQLPPLCIASCSAWDVSNRANASLAAARSPSVDPCSTRLRIACRRGLAALGVVP